MTERQEKLKQALHPIAEKRIQQMSTATNNPLFFISNAELPKNPDEMINFQNCFVSADEQKYVYLKDLAKEINETQNTAAAQIRHIENSFLEQTIAMESDMKRVENYLVDFIKKLVEKYKEGIKAKLSEANQINLRPMFEIRDKILEMKTEGSELIRKLNSNLFPQIVLTEEKKVSLQQDLNQIQQYYEEIKKVKNVANNVSFEQLVVNWNLPEDDLKTAQSKTRLDFHESFEKTFSNMDFINTIISKPEKVVSGIDIYESLQVYKASDYKSLVDSKIKPIGAFELSKHTSHHVHCSYLLNENIMLTGHSDCTFKIWGLNPDYFNSRSLVPKKNTMQKSTKMEDLSEKKQPFRLQFTSTNAYHKHYVTAICCYERTYDLKTLLITGDGIGNFQCCYVNYEKPCRRVASVTEFFKVDNAHGKLITHIDRFKKTDTIFLSSHDMSISVWNIMEKVNILRFGNHSNSVQGFQFIDNFNMIATFSNEELKIWNIESSAQDTLEVDIQARKEMSYYDNSKSSQRQPTSRPDETSRTLTVSMHKDIALFSDQAQPILSYYQKCFSTNFAYDYLLFVTSGADIKLLNILSGDYVGEIEGAHFKGTLNFGVICDESTSSSLKETLAVIKSKIEKQDLMNFYKNPDQVMNEDNSNTDDDPLFDQFVELLNCYLQVSVSNKEKIKLWKFEDGTSKNISTENSMGGISDNMISFVKNKNKGLVMIVTGQTSNKAELFQIS